MAFITDAPSRTTNGNHAGQWGLAALLLSALVLILFPLLVGLLFASMVGAYNNAFLKSEDLDLGISGGWAVVGGVAALAVLALACGVIGLVAAGRRGQPLGLSLAGTIIAVVAVVAGVVLLLAGQRTGEWLRWLQKERYQHGIWYPSGQGPR
jgi:hypothetical protein